MSDLVERMAKACYAAWDAMGSSARGIPAVNWAHIGENTKEGYRVEARAAMAILIEEAARVAESEEMEGAPPAHLSPEQVITIKSTAKVTARSIARKIRKLGKE
jgi:hypothetical protein